jgi:hypothetical protein
MQLDEGIVLPPVIVVVPTHWPARMRSAASAGKARQANTQVRSSAL